MKNEKIKCFEGNYILPFGRPTVILIGWETHENFCCEWFVLLETITKTMEYHCNCISTNAELYKLMYKIDDSNLALENFMINYGKKATEGYIFNDFMKKMTEKKYKAINIQLFDSEKEIVSVLYYIKKNYPKALKSVEQNTRSLLLKQMITLADKLNIINSTAQ